MPGLESIDVFSNMACCDFTLRELFQLLSARLAFEGRRIVW